MSIETTVQEDAVQEDNQLITAEEAAKLTLDDVKKDHRGRGARSVHQKDTAPDEEGSRQKRRQVTSCGVPLSRERGMRF